MRGICVRNEVVDTSANNADLTYTWWADHFQLNFNLKLDTVSFRAVLCNFKNISCQQMQTIVSDCEENVCFVAYDIHESRKSWKRFQCCKVKENDEKELVRLLALRLPELVRDSDYKFPSATWTFCHTVYANSYLVSIKLNKYLIIKLREHKKKSAAFFIKQRASYEEI